MAGWMGRTLDSRAGEDLGSVYRDYWLIYGGEPWVVAGAVFRCYGLCRWGARGLTVGHRGYQVVVGACSL